MALSIKKNAGLLLRGAALSAAEAWVDRRPAKAPSPGQEVMDLILTSRRAAITRQRRTRIIVATTALTFLAVIGAGILFALWSLEQRKLESQANYVSEFARTQLQNGDPSLAAGVLIETVDAMPGILSSSGSAELKWSLLGTLHKLKERALISVEAGVRQLKRHPSADLVLMVTGTNVISIWDLAGQEQLASSNFDNSLAAVEFSDDGERVLIATDEGSLIKWSWRSKNDPSIHKIAFDSRLASFNTSRNRLALLSSDGQLCFAEVHSLHKKCTQAVDVASDVTAIKWGGERLYLARNDGGILVTRNGAEASSIIAPSDFSSVRSLKGNSWRLEVDPLGRRAVTWLGSTKHWKNKAFLWDLETGRLVSELKGSNEKHDRARGVVFNSDGSQLVLKTRKTASIWNAKSGGLLGHLFGHTAYIRGAAFSPNDQQVVTWSYDRTSRIWQSHDGKLVDILSGHDDRVQNAVWSVDGCSVITGSDDLILPQ